MEIRTDLALENQENLNKEQIKGLQIEEKHYINPLCDITKVIISSAHASQVMKKPIGNYITLEIPLLLDGNDENMQHIADLIGNECKQLILSFPLKKDFSVLIAGLGNRDVTPDALGPMTIDHITPTRHYSLFSEKKIANVPKHSISCFSPDVLAKTGMESAEIIHALIKKTTPDLLIVIDALAARSIHRLYTTIQITNTGIHPGSGVGNHRSALTKESLGIPVIAIGIPTVVDAFTIVQDYLNECLSNNPLFQNCDTRDDSLNQSFMYDSLHSMYVTTKDIDEVLHKISLTLSLSINQMFFNA